MPANGSPNGVLHDQSLTKISWVHTRQLACSLPQPVKRLRPRLTGLDFIRLQVVRHPKMQSRSPRNNSPHEHRGKAPRLQQRHKPSLLFILQKRRRINKARRQCKAVFNSRQRQLRIHMLYRTPVRFPIRDAAKFERKTPSLYGNVDGYQRRVST